MNQDDQPKQPERTRRFEDNAPPADVDPTAPARLVMVGFRVVTRTWWQVKALFAETAFKTETLIQALKEGHGIEIIDHKNPTLYFVVNEDQMEALLRHGVASPTWLQLVGTCEVISLSEEDAVARFTALKENQ